VHHVLPRRKLTCITCRALLPGPFNTTVAQAAVLVTRALFSAI